jgi:murein DD-endopeptidase MepM/ murein hydrolase activator NlpD
MDAFRTARRRGAFVAILSAAVSALLIPASTPALSDPRDDKKRIDAEVARAASILEGATERAQDAAKRLAAATTALPGAEQRVAEAGGRVVAAEVAANTARREAAAAQAALADATERYAASERLVARARDRVGEFVNAAYRGADIASINVLLDARSPSEVAERFGYLDRVVATEQAAVDALVAARWSARQAQNEATAAEQRAVQAHAAADASLTAAKIAQAEAMAAKAEVAALAEQRTEALSVAEQERAASLARYEEARAAAARIEAELREWEARQRATGGTAAVPPMRAGARFLMPVRGWKSSDFGMRYDPYYQVWQLHAGVDIAANGGQPIYAAADGKVMRAGWNGGYGNFTCLSHGAYQGSGLSTCYAHQSRILVDPGQRVRRGQVIGRVGTTGASTGYHLHFEVRLDGTPKNPLRWLPGCLC